ncbi:MAG: 16S rRNA (cytosine(1402)-N(4))-methyltransferase RsmH [Chloroflexi bacterium]|nr:16S rRNA (cytosine(1402)-N(4))-methyltransferase RsmH [Chloroflexota bacterium]
MSPLPMQHIPVLVAETLEALRVRPGGTYIDGTLGLGGHAGAILRASAPDGRVLGLEVDKGSAALARERLREFEGRYQIAMASYSTIQQTAERLGFSPADGVLLDLGLSSWQLEQSGRGFSFQAEEPLDMRFSTDTTLTAARIVNVYPVQELERILREYGEEPQARRIARHIIARRPLKTAAELARVVEDAVGGRHGRIHPATRAFQALRIAVNQELEAVTRGLADSVRVLAPGGRLAVISYHSLEDRAVKQFFQRESRDCICPPGLPVCQCGHTATLRPITRGVVRPTAQEVQANPRSRSARLRAAERL